MPPEIAKLLWDMDDAALKIQLYSSGRTFADYAKDDYFRSAVERQFVTIGEAMTRLLKPIQRSRKALLTIARSRVFET